MVWYVPVVPGVMPWYIHTCVLNDDAYSVTIILASQGHSIIISSTTNDLNETKGVVCIK